MRPDFQFFHWSIKAATSPRTGKEVRAVLSRGRGWGVSERDAGSGGGGDDPSESRRYYGWEAATDLLRQMSDMGVAPDSTTYTLVMSACRRDGEPERALDVLRGMQELVAAAAAAQAEETAAVVPSQTEAAGEANCATTAAAPAADDDGDDGHGDGGGDDAGNVTKTVDTDAAAAVTAPAASSDSVQRRREPVSPNAIHYSAVMAAFAKQTGGWKRILTLIQEMEVIFLFFPVFLDVFGHVSSGSSFGT